MPGMRGVSQNAWGRFANRCVEAGCVAFCYICKVCCLHDYIYAFFAFCNATFELAACLCRLEVLPTAQPHQLASLARCLGSVGAPKAELVQFYDALEDF